MQPRRSVTMRTIRLMLLGAVALAPLMVTVWLFSLLTSMGAKAGAVIARPVAHWLPDEGAVSAAVHLLLVAGVLLLVGAAASSPLGRALGAAADRMIEPLPGVRTVYRSVQQMLAGLTDETGDTRKVVLIEFPSPTMKAVGLVTRRFTAADTGEQLAAVYVPTTPNPSSGYIEIVPVERLVWLDWTAQDAIQFVVSGGVVGPDTITFRPGTGKRIADGKGGSTPV